MRTIINDRSTEVNNNAMRNILIVQPIFILLSYFNICHAYICTRCNRLINPSKHHPVVRVLFHRDNFDDEYHETNVHTTHRRSYLRNVIQGFTISFFGSIPISSQPVLAQYLNSAPSTDQSKVPSGAGNGKTTRRIGGLASKIRGITLVMDELQRDLMQERWDLVESYPAQLRSFVPIFTTYTDSAFPSDAPTDKGLRVALRYEVGRYFASVERLKQSCSRKSLDEAYIAYSDMSLHFDRYLRVGGLYTYYDATISNEPYFQGISDSTLIYANQQRDPPLVRDLIVLISGPDKGKTGIVIGLYKDGSNKAVVKLDRYKGLREIRVVSNSWVAKRLGEQAPDDVFLIPRKTFT